MNSPLIIDSMFIWTASLYRSFHPKKTTKYKLMPNNQYKVGIPRDPSMLIAPLAAIKAEHEKLGATSPLAGLNWTAISAALTEATAQDQLSDELHRRAQIATGARDMVMPQVTDAVRAARDVLLGIYRSNPDALGAFGFDVADAASKPTSPPASAPDKTAK